MSPDLNSVPPSPRPFQPSTQADASQQRHPSAPPSRRASQLHAMGPPPLPLASPGGAIPASVQVGHIPFPPLSPAESGSGSGSGGGVSMPTRHPRPMTPAEMHLELEKEQEAIVNRLTRELSVLRAHSSSVASTTSMSSSSTNAAYHDPSASSATLDTTPSTHPVPHRTRQHRSSSSVSSSRLPNLDPPASTPSAAARTPSVSTGAGGPLMPTTPRYEEVLLHRQELEEAKRENERLRRRVRELEGMVRGRRASSVSTGIGASGSASERERSVSVRRVDARNGVEATPTAGGADGTG